MAEALIPPSASRAARMDGDLRRGMASSLEYLATIPAIQELKDDLGTLAVKVGSGSVSPWLFGFYSRLVADLSRGESARAVASARGMMEAGAVPSPPRAVVPLLADGPPTGAWDQFQVLFDTDPRRSFRLRPPDAATFERCLHDLHDALSLLERAAPDFAAEVAATIRMIVLASPANEQSAFNGASTFFMWGAALFNSEPRRSLVRFCDLLVHETSHLLLFGRSANAPLTENRGDERLNSPLRKDRRPVDGVFHACFVATRVHCAMGDMLGGGMLRPDETADAIACRRYNGEAARNGLATVSENARLTPLGREVFDELKAYWAGQGRGEGTG